MTLEKGWLKRQSDKIEQDLSTWPDWMKANGEPSHHSGSASHDTNVSGVRKRELESVED